MTGRNEPPEPGSQAEAPPHPVLARYYEGAEARPAFVRRLFDRTAIDYDRINGIFSFGSGGRYRRDVLRRAGLKPGLRTLDVAIGTGLVAAEAIRLCGNPADVVGLDLSFGMLGQARRKLALPLIQGRAEALPLADGSFDVLTMGYALRHVADLGATFREFARVLKPGGIVVILEIGRPRRHIPAAALRWYVGRVVPALSGLVTRRAEARLLMEYYWDTIANCVEPEAIQRNLAEAGFGEVGCSTFAGVFRNYAGRKPG